MSMSKKNAHLIRKFFHLLLFVVHKFKKKIRKIRNLEKLVEYVAAL